MTVRCWLLILLSAQSVVANYTCSAIQMTTVVADATFGAIPKMVRCYLQCCPHAQSVRTTCNAAPFISRCWLLAILPRWSAGADCLQYCPLDQSALTACNTAPLITRCWLLAILPPWSVGADCLQYCPLDQSVLTAINTAPLISRCWLPAMLPPPSIHADHLKLCCSSVTVHFLLLVKLSIWPVVSN